MGAIGCLAFRSTVAQSAVAVMVVDQRIMPAKRVVTPFPELSMPPCYATFAKCLTSYPTTTTTGALPSVSRCSSICPNKVLRRRMLGSGLHGTGRRSFRSGPWRARSDPTGSAGGWFREISQQIIPHVKASGIRARPFETSVRVGETRRRDGLMANRQSVGACAIPTRKGNLLPYSQPALSFSSTWPRMAATGKNSCRSRRPSAYAVRASVVPTLKNRTAGSGRNNGRAGTARLQKVRFRASILELTRMLA